jgi:hypothetical protein
MAHKIQMAEQGVQEVAEVIQVLVEQGQQVRAIVVEQEFHTGLVPVGAAQVL